MRLFCARSLTVLVLATLLALASSLTVHLVPHTHDDVGWQVTVDQYYTGSVQYIITTVIEQLLVNPDRKFIYVEMAFFTRWWRQQNDVVKQQVHDLVKSGQLEFINGGWCMHDEASTHFIDMVDQTTLGHRFINEEFHVQPKVGWQIDPFGHSSTQASLLSGEAGFMSLFFGRIDYQDYAARAATKRLEWLWRASPALGAQSEVFAGQFWNGYGPPGGFDFNIGSNDEPIQDDPRLDDYNVDARVNDFVRAAQEQSRIFQGEDLMWTMGSDFNYEAAHEWFTNLDKLIAAVNKDGRVTARYSTPSEYTIAKNKANLTFTVKTDDIFPYSDGPNGYWTGYFTSRAALKRYVRVQSQFLQVARHVELFSGGNGQATEALWAAIAVAQHHDGVSGTARQAVTLDYAQRMSVGGAAADQVLESGLATLLTKAGGDKLKFAYCSLANTSICQPTSTGTNVVTVLYNSLARPQTSVIRVPTSSSSATVYDGTGAVVTSQIVPVLAANPARTADSLNYEVRFQATVPGLGASTYFLLFKPAAAVEAAVEESVLPVLPAVAPAVVEEDAEEEPSMYSRTLKSIKTASTAPPSISNQFLKLDFDQYGLLAQVTDLTTGESFDFSQQFWWYHSFAQNRQQNSGAYIFRPTDPKDAGTLVAASATVTVITGPVSSEVQQVFAPWLTQIIRLNNNSQAIEFEYTVGPIPIDDNQGKEIITRYTSDIESDGVFYTDSNGREWQQRVRNQRPAWKWNATQPVAGNYYPANAGAWLASSGYAMSVLNDRTQGCSSLVDGQLEFMLHRRLLADDGRGVGEPLNETGLDGKGLIVSGSHYVQFAGPLKIAAATRLLQQRVYSAIHQSYAPLSGSVADYLSTHNAQFTGLNHTLPANVELMSAYRLNATAVLIRLSHSFGIGEDATLSQPVTIDLASVFVASFTPKTVTEVSLTNNQSPADISKSKLQWNTNGANKHLNLNPERSGRSLQATTVTISPMEVRTFVLGY